MTDAGARVLVVEDDPALRTALRTSLRARGFAVREVASGDEAVVAVADGLADLVLLDLSLVGMQGDEVLTRIRAFSPLPVIIVTARESQAEKVRLLDAGADDYVTKPFDPDELVARMRAALRRMPDATAARAVVQAHGVEIDLARRQVTVDGEPVHLTRTELALLEVLATNPGKLLTHGELLKRVWGPAYGTETEYLRVYVAQLRRKLGDDAAAPRFIVTEPGIGYRWIAEA